MRKKIQLTIAFIAIWLSCNARQKDTTLIQGKVQIPFEYMFNYGYATPDSARIIITDSLDKILLDIKGYTPFWGLKTGGKFTHTGKYKLEVFYYPDSLTKKQAQEFIEINGDETLIEIGFDIRSGNEGPINQFLVYKYYNNKYNIQLKRLWDPQYQYKSGKELLPDYEWTNTSDSVLFGVYRQFYSSSMIHLIKKWDIAFMAIQKLTDSGWIFTDCNAPRIQALLKKGETGQTLKDMNLSCPNEKFQKNQKYRIILQYCINNALYRNIKADGKYQETFYYERPVYEITDEFILK